MINNILYLFILGALTTSGCILQAEEESEGLSESETFEEESIKPDWFDDNLPNDLGCVGEQFELPNGQVLTLPGLCDPLELYFGGYPDPTQFNEFESEIYEE